MEYELDGEAREHIMKEAWKAINDLPMPERGMVIEVVSMAYADGRKRSAGEAAMLFA